MKQVKAAFFEALLSTPTPKVQVVMNTDNQHFTLKLWSPTITSGQMEHLG